MATSPLYDGNIGGRRDRSIARGHGTRALGPSDSSDSGSDLIGGADPEELGEGIDEANAPEPPTPEPDEGPEIHADRIEKIRPDDETQ